MATLAWYRFGQLLLGLLTSMSVVATVDAAEPVVWKTQPAFRRQLDEIASINWQQSDAAAGLASRLARLSEANGIAMFLDRHIDPSQVISVRTPDQPLHAVLKRIAEAAHAEVTTLGPVVYIGPPSAVSTLPTIAAVRRQDAAKFGPDQAARFLRQQAWNWDELAEPRELLADLAREAGVTISNAEAMPHDLWRAGSLPPLPWADRLTLLLVGFGLTYEFDERGAALRLVPLPTSVLLEKTYTPPGDAAELAARLRPLMPGAELRVSDGKLIVAAPQADHERIERLLTGQGAPARAAARQGKTAKEPETLYSLRVNNEPAGKVARTVAESLGKELRYDRELLEKLRQPVSVDVKNATLEYLLELTLQPLGLTYRVTDKALEIVPQQRPK